MFARRAVVTLSIAIACAFPAHAEDLAKRYKATLDAQTPARPVEWTCGAKDAWKLERFALDRGAQLKLALGPGTVVFGVRDTNAVWAVVRPAEPAPLASTVAGAGERVTSVLLRFNPKRVGDLFPANTVGKNAPEDALLWARRVVAHGLTESGFSYDSFPIVMQRGQMVVDCEIEGGGRRVFYVDTDKNTVELDARLAQSTLPPPVPMESATCVEVFDAAWKEFDHTYAKFGLRPEVDWDALQKRFRPIAQRCTTSWEAATTIALLLEPLRDLHIHVKCGEEWMPRSWRFRPQNGVMSAAKAVVGELHELSPEVSWARAKDGVGYLQVNGVGGEGVTTAVDAALEQLADTWGLVLDLRFNGGGGTDIAAQVAGRFVDAEKVYANSLFRAGTSKRTQLGEKKPRTFAPRGPWRYAAPVAVLLGQKCMSSGEELALMLAQCPQAVSFGDHTAGSSAAPKPLELAGGIVVNVPRWNDCDAAGKPYEDIGIPPKFPVKAEPEEFTPTRDPVIEAALAYLRKTPANKRGPAKP